PSGAGPATFDDTTGAVTGVVTDDELTPLPDAELLLRPADMTMRSAPDGSFAFSNVPPGRQTLLAVKLGHGAVSVDVEVRAGEETSGVTVVLPPLPTVQPRQVTIQFTGFITCSVGHAGVLSEECGEGLQTPVGTYGKNPRNNIDWKFNVSDVEDLENVFVELDWEPASAAAQQLGLNVAQGFTCTPSCEAEETYCSAFDVYGRPVVSCDMSLGRLEETKAEAPWDITARAWAAPVDVTETPNVVFEQPFTMYRSDFWVEPKPDSFSAVKDT
ncbi:MAG TPA: carboxypeptidase-like regulatory domain-containing protein, partial [Candidatus Thermoplasmatota archaeon]|nr:carboxypeptidase-like regulatory domain-containing protein [Candidatus Thermoplasmatota archaeon]